MTEYTTKVQQHKTDSVNYLKDRFANTADFVFTDYRGLSVLQISELRTKLRQHNAEFRVVKNRFAMRALEQMKMPDASGMLVGPTALALPHDESGPVVKALIEFGKSSTLEVKGAIIEGQVFTKEQTEAYSRLPTRLELISMLMGTMKAPLQNLVFVMNGVSSKLVRTLVAVAEQKKEQE